MSQSRTQNLNLISNNSISNKSPNKSRRAPSSTKSKNNHPISNNNKPSPFLNHGEMKRSANGKSTCIEVTNHQRSDYLSGRNLQNGKDRLNNDSFNNGINGRREDNNLENIFDSLLSDEKNVNFFDSVNRFYSNNF